VEPESTWFEGRRHQPPNVRGLASGGVPGGGAASRGVTGGRVAGGGVKGGGGEKSKRQLDVVAAPLVPVSAKPPCQPTCKVFAVARSVGTVAVLADAC
jgi:hypothetical protein